MTTAPEYRPTTSVLLAPSRTNAVSAHSRAASAQPLADSPHSRADSVQPRLDAAPVLRRLPLPVTEPPFDDQVGRTAGHPTAVGAQGRIVYLTGTAPGPMPVLAAAGAAAVVVAPLTPTDTSHAAAPQASVEGSRSFSARAVGPVVDSLVDVLEDPLVAFPVRLHLVTPPVARRGSPSTRGVRPARSSRPTTPLERPDPSDGFAPGPRVDVDSTATRSRLLGTTDDADAASRAAAAPLSDPRPLAAQVVQAVAEILAGDRQLTQLTAWVDEEVYAAVAAAAPAVARTPAPSARRTGPVRTRPEDRPMVRSVHVCQPGPGVAEVIARVQTGGRSCAVALRLEGWRGRWRCNALTVG